MTTYTVDLDFSVSKTYNVKASTPEEAREKAVKHLYGELVRVQCGADLDARVKGFVVDPATLEWSQVQEEVGEYEVIG